MTDHDINRVLAEKVMGWTVTTNGFRASDPNTIFDDGGSLWIGSGCRLWSPTTDRNDLAEVLAKLTDDQWKSVEDALYAHYQSLNDVGYFGHWLLTCDQRIIAQAVVEVVKSGSTAAS